MKCICYKYSNSCACPFNAKNMANLTLLTTLLGILCVGFTTYCKFPGPNQVAVCTTAECLKSAERLSKSMNHSVSPCDDFYHFACGNTSAGTFETLDELNEQELLAYVKKKNDNNEPKILHKIRRLFNLCTAGGNVKGRRFGIIKNVLKDLNLPVSPPLSNNTIDFDLTYTLAKVTKLLPTTMEFFVATVSSDPFDTRTNILKISNKKNDLNIATGTGYEKADIINDALRSYCEIEPEVCPLMQEFLNFTINHKNYHKFEKYVEYMKSKSMVIKQGLNSEDQNISYDIMTLNELLNMTNKIAANNNMTAVINWNRYVEVLFTGVNNFKRNDNDRFRILISNRTYLEEAIKFLHKESMENHRFGLWWNVVGRLLTMSNYSEPQSSSMKYQCFSNILHVFGKPLSYFYLTNEEHKNYRKKNNINEMVTNIKSILRASIENATWIDPKTKANGLWKVDAVTQYIDYPKVIANGLDKAYKKLPITDDYFETELNIYKHTLQNRLNEINKRNPLGKDNGDVPPTMFNAAYDPNTNAIYIPAAILRSPFVNNGLQALNYGGIGTIIGHEITHGFDINGRMFNFQGDFKNWWKNSTLKTYEEKSKCFIEAYEKNNVSGHSIEIDGKFTLSENVADNGGFKEALLGYRKYVRDHGAEPLLAGFENYTPEQLFSLNYGHIWCSNHENQFSWDPHSTGILRVNIVMRNSKYFGDIWNCPVGSPMNPTEKCELW